MTDRRSHEDDSHRLLDPRALGTVGMRPEEAIRKSEARLKEAQRLTHIGSWELDLTTNRLGACPTLGIAKNPTHTFGSGSTIVT